jgi:hypothetical protein
MIIDERPRRPRNRDLFRRELLGPISQLRGRKGSEKFSLSSQYVALTFGIPSWRPRMRAKPQGWRLTSLLINGAARIFEATCGRFESARRSL